MLEYADLALYQVKRAGRNAYSMYDPAIHVATSRIPEGEVLLQALRDEEFSLKYQPIVDARTGELRGLEAYIRRQPQGLMEVSAKNFMPLVEQKRLTSAFSEWVLDAVFRQYRDWTDQGLALVPVTINVGTVEFATQDLLGSIQKLGASYGTGWDWLRLDIKEEALLADVGFAIRKLGMLRDAGVGANLDNFARGFAPLGYLSQLPFVGIKLDGTLLQHSRDLAYLHGLVDIIRNIAQVVQVSLTVTKVETLKLREALSSQSIDCVQGYAIASPASAAAAAEWLRRPGQVS